MKASGSHHKLMPPQYPNNSAVSKKRKNIRELIYGAAQEDEELKHESRKLKVRVNETRD
jgi:hypothetical protein